MKHNKFTKLDSFFKARLGQDKIMREDWNTPDDALLDGVWASLDSKEKKKPFGYYWIGIALFLLIGIVGIKYHFSKVASLNDQITSLEAIALEKIHDNKKVEQKDLASEAVTTNEAIIERETSEVIKPSPPKKVVSNPTLASNQTIGLVENERLRNIKSSNDYKVNNNNNSTLEIPTNLDQTPSYVSRNETSNQREELLTSTKSGTSILELVEVINLPVNNLKGLAIKDKTPIVNTSLEPYTPLEIKNESVSGKTAIYATVGSLFTNYKMVNSDPTSVRLLGYDKVKKGWTVGLGVNHEIKKNTLVSIDLGYKKISNWSQYNDQLVYDKDNEYSNQAGDIMYDDALRISTTMGSFDDRVIMNMAGADMEEGDIMNNTTEINQSLHVISLGLGLEQRLINSNRFRLGVFATVGVNKIVSWSQTLDTKISINPSKEFNFSFVEDDTDKTCSLFYDASIGIRTGFVLNDNWSLNLSGAFNGSLNPINNYNLDTDPQTYIRGFQSNVGLMYSF